jgi:integrase
MLANHTAQRRPDDDGGERDSKGGEHSVGELAVLELSDAALLEPSLPTEVAEPTKPPAANEGAVLLGQVAALAAASRRAPKTRADYQRIYDHFTAWLASQLGRAPVTADLSEAALLGWRIRRETSGGRAGTGVARATLRVELAALRVLARKAGRPDLAVDLALPRHHPAPPVTLTDAEYERLLAMPNRARTIGRRDAAILQLLGDAGLRSAELRALRIRDLLRARRDSPRRSLRVSGKGGRGRLVRLTRAADEALDRWLAVHPARLPRTQLVSDDAPLVCTLGRGGRDAGRPLSADALERLVAHHAHKAGLPRHLAHPHVLRRYCLTRLAELGTPIQRIAGFAGHADIRVTQQYLAGGDPDLIDTIEAVDVHTATRSRGG